MIAGSWVQRSENIRRRRASRSLSLKLSFTTISFASCLTPPVAPPVYPEVGDLIEQLIEQEYGSRDEKSYEKLYPSALDSLHESNAKASKRFLAPVIQRFARDYDDSINPRTSRACRAVCSLTSLHQTDRFIGRSAEPFQRHDMAIAGYYKLIDRIMLIAIHIDLYEHVLH
jgi:hypothetical protein